METKHTKGEWFVQGKNLIKCGNEQIGSANSMIDEYEANAKLISAAPELLDACIKAYNMFNSAPLSAMDILQNAIKKATE